MSCNENQWEVVTKSKKQIKLSKMVEAHKEKKKAETLLPKLEEILPFEQYRNIITGANGQDNNSPAESNASAKSKGSTPKKTKKSAKEHIQQVDSHKKAKNDTSKAPAKPKSLEQALKNLTVDEFASHLQLIKFAYPGYRLQWLLELANYLNSYLPFECDPLFSGKSSTYPSNLLSPGIKQAIIDFFSFQTESNLEYFFHYTLMVNMCTTLNKNQPVVGYKLLLQIIGQNWPYICSDEKACTAMLKDSYRNRSTIFLSIFWAISQGGYQNLMEGIKVWQNLMLPNITMKNYSRYITEYIEKILNTANDQNLNINQKEFFDTYNALKKQYPGLPRECQESLLRSSSLFLQKYIVKTNGHANIFVNLLRDKEINGCFSALLHNDDCFKVWKMNYKKQLVPTITLLQKLETELFDSANSLDLSPKFHNFLNEAEILNAELKSSKKADTNIDILTDLVKSLQEKTAQQKKKQTTEQKKKKCGCCKFALGSILLIALIAGALFYDTEVNGKGVFAKSATGKVLQNAGVLPHVEKVWYTSMSSAARGYKWAENNLPPFTKPLSQLSCDIYKVMRNIACNAVTGIKELCIAKYPVAAEFLEQYVPGLPEKIENTASTVKTVSLDLCGKVLDFFKTQVLVGQLSPENLYKTFNQTQILALEYYNQFHKKVDAYAKLK